MDGAGKSTQIDRLRSRAIENGQRVSIVTYWDDVARLTNLRATSSHALFKGDKGVGSPEAPIVRRDKNVRSWAMTGVRYVLYLIDAISLRQVVHRHLKSDADLIIFDRYVYDELANLNLRNPVARLYVRAIMSFIPLPDVSYILDADPEKAFARKPEYPQEFLEFSRASYLRLSELMGGMTVIPPMSINEVTSAIWGFAHPHLSPREEPPASAAMPGSRMHPQASPEGR